jgi:2-polyprenyl-3-methyl-5-hydroxy-6-metoxy-1,4-benzoquinol methylase
MTELSYDERLKNALAEQHRKCFDQHRKALRPEYAEYIDCPVCDSSNKELFFEKDWFTFSRCRDCAMVYLNPRLNEQATYAFYNSDWNAIYNETKFDEVSSSTRLDDEINQANLDRVLHARNGARGALLEIGCGNGFFLRAAKAAGFEVSGLELNERNFRRSRADLGDGILNLDLFSAGFPSDRFDVLYMRDVFEHVPNPKAMLKEMCRIAKPGCVVFIEVPNIEGLMYKMVRQRHICVFGFEHLNYWAPATLGKLLETTGFTVREVIHSSLDFSLRDVFLAYSRPGFTTLFPDDSSPPVRKVADRLSRLFGHYPLVRWDPIVTRALANFMRRGSVIKVLAEK